ncbi:hypothetical protein Misp03_44420 [Microbispora sp. NBRC 16548]|nr:hypothetical protein Misp03_44420 [Microbispora sp. NBRC 16548]
METLVQQVSGYTAGGTFHMHGTAGEDRLPTPEIAVGDKVGQERQRALAAGTRLDRSGAHLMKMPADLPVAQCAVGPEPRQQRLPCVPSERGLREDVASHPVGRLHRLA